ncbi:MAG TPA: NifU family protein [Gaiellaceae bacterium]|nr:NifU family protein [Gaiellaceae bacterium]
MEDGEVRARVAEVESLLDAIEGNEAATEAMAAVVELYGEALGRLVAGADPVEDELVSHLLLLHDLHPVDLETRVRNALEEVKPYLRSHGGDVELVEIKDDVARLRLAGTCNGCPSSSTTMRLAIEDAVNRAAPELAGIDAEGVPETGPTLVQLGSFGKAPAAGAEGSWSIVGSLPQLAGGGTVVREVGGEPLLFARVDGTPYSYRGPCPACAAGLEGAELDDAELACPGCGRRYDLRRAGRCLDVPSLSLEPVPLLESQAGLLKVAVA